MSQLKDEKLGNLISELAAEYINVESNKGALITVTRSIVENRGKKVTVYFTVLPESEQNRSLEFLQRKQPDFRKFVISKKSVGFAPSISFAIDYGERNRQRIDEISNETKR